MRQHEVLVIGGGVVGAALTLDLRRRGLDACLLEGGARPKAFDATVGDARVYAVSPASARYLAELDVWPGVHAVRAQPYRQMKIWEASGAGDLRFQAADLPAPNLGWIIEHSLLVDQLWAALGDHALADSRVESIERLEKSVVVEAAGGQVHTAQLLIAADGGQSMVRQWAQIDTDGWAYEQVGIVCTVQPQHHHQETAWQRFLPTGPLALLPLADGRVSIVWSADADHAHQLLAMTDAEFRRALTLASDGCLGEILAVEPRQRFPLRLQQAQHYVAEQVALVGDAAHVVHPLAGQGANLGWADARALAAQLSAGAAGGKSPWRLRNLRRYERQRQAANLDMLAVTDLLYRSYRWRHPAWNALRGVGMGLVDGSGLLKQALMREAMGSL